MELVKYDQCQYLSDTSRSNDSFNADPFIGRVCSLLIEHGVKISYGEYFCKVKSVGHIKVLKSLGLYQTKGRGPAKTIYVHPLVLLVVKTTISDHEIVAKTIRELFEGVYSGYSVNIADMTSYQNIPMTLKPVKNGGYYTYIMYKPSTMSYKIGRTRSVFTRLKQIQFEYGENNIILVAYLNADKEAQIHLEYKDNRLFGEWFNITSDDVRQIIDNHGFESLM